MSTKQQPQENWSGYTNIRQNRTKKIIRGKTSTLNAKNVNPQRR